METRKIFMYALSTCGWCKKTKALLRERNVDFEFVDVDLLSGEERDRVRDEMAKVNPRKSFPTLVVGDDVIVGYDRARILEAVGDGQGASA